jgi:hypothetical protein
MSYSKRKVVFLDWSFAKDVKEVERGLYSQHFPLIIFVFKL